MISCGATASALGLLVTSQSRIKWFNTSEQKDRVFHQTISLCMFTSLAIGRECTLRALNTTASSRHGKVLAEFRSESRTWAAGPLQNLGPAGSPDRSVHICDFVSAATVNFRRAGFYNITFRAPADNVAKILLTLVSLENKINGSVHEFR